MRCPSCRDPGTLVCAGCKNVSYCSLVCQQSDWQFHRHLCKEFQHFQIRPSPRMCRVISFPKRADGKPEFAWLDVTDDGEDDENGPSVVVDPHPLMNDIAHREVAFNENKILGVKLDTHINLCYDDDFVYNYDHENAAIHSATNGKCHIKWKGPMFAYGGERNESENMEKIVDMDMNSYADIVAWLINYRNDSAAHRFRKGPKVKGVRMRCDGGSAAERMEFAMVPRMHPIFDNGEFSEISQKMGFPLRFRKDVTKKAAEPDDPKQSNSTLTSMMRSCNIKDENKFGLPLPHWQAGQTSDTLVVRADGQHMDPENWEFFGHYCEKVLQPGFRRAAEELDQNGDFLTAAESVLDSMKFEKWVVYASAWQHTEKESAPVPSPIEHEAIPVEATAPVEVTAPAEPAAPEEGSQTRYMLRKRKSVHFEDEAVYAGEMEPTGADGKKQRVTYQKPTGYDEDDDEPDVKPKVESFDDYEAIHGKLEMEPVAEESDAKMKMEPGSDEDAMDTT